MSERTRIATAYDSRKLVCRSLWQVERSILIVGDLGQLLVPGAGSSVDFFLLGCSAFGYLQAPLGGGRGALGQMSEMAAECRLHVSGSSIWVSVAYAVPVCRSPVAIALHG